MFGKRESSEGTLVVVFDSTASALAFADAAKRAGLAGRLIPVPRSLSAGCGIAWRTRLEDRSLAETLIDTERIDDARIVAM